MKSETIWAQAHNFYGGASGAPIDEAPSLSYVRNGRSWTRSALGLPNALLGDGSELGGYGSTAG